MKKILLLIAVIILTGEAYAQFPQAMPGSTKNMGHVYGKITDSDGKPVNGASVLIMQQKMDSAIKKMKMILVTGMTTKSNGDFDFAQLPVMNKLQLRISNTGYKALQQDISFMPKKQPGIAPSGPPSFDKDLGNIKL
ncbi:MAG: carboxypeptidase-like regulatory domain-containing protein, partial [Bacteroidia bacterium]